MRHIFRFIAETQLPEVFTATALLLVIGITLAMERIGLSPALGTFLAGVVLANNEYRHELESNIAPFKGLLLGLFFISVGASIDFDLLVNQPWVILGIVLVLVSLKFSVLILLGTIWRMPLGERFLFAFSLAQGSEFAFVLLTFAITNGVLSDEMASLFVVSVALSMLVTPPLMIANDKVIQPRFRGTSKTPEPDAIPENNNRVIIAGFGRFGQIAGRLLLANGVEPTVLDHDPTQIEALRRFGHRVFYGNATRLDLLHAAGAEQATLLIIAVDETEMALEIAETAGKHFPHLTLSARAHDRVHAYELKKRNVHMVHRETFDSALELGVAALKALGYHPYQARRLGQIFKRHDERALQKAFQIYGDEKAYIAETHRQAQALGALLKKEHEEPGLEPDGAWDVTELGENVHQGRF